VTGCDTPTSAAPAEPPVTGDDQALAESIVLRAGDLPDRSAQPLPDLGGSAGRAFLDQALSLDAALRQVTGDDLSTTTGVAVSDVLAREIGPDTTSFWVIGQVTVHANENEPARLIRRYADPEFAACLRERLHGLLALELSGVRTAVTSSGSGELDVPPVPVPAVAHRLAVTFDLVGERASLYLDMWNLVVGRCALQVVVDSVLRPADGALMDEAAQVMIQRAQAAASGSAPGPGCGGQTGSQGGQTGSQ